MTDSDSNKSMNDALRRARNHNRWTATLDGIETPGIEPEQEVTEEAEESGPPKVPDLGQGARGGLQRQPLDMSERLRRDRDWQRSGYSDAWPGNDAA